jgi:predicted negative regulator of RcsB-dependent stress response
MSNNEIVENEEQAEYIEQEESSSPSGVSLFVDKIKNWLNGQNKMAVYGIGGVIVLILGYGGYKYFYQLPRETEGLSAIYTIQNDFENDSFKLVIKNAPKMADKYSGTKAGELCEYMAGISYMYTGDYKKALEWLEKVDFDDEVMSVMATGNIGDCYVELKDLDNGLKYYLKAISNAKADYTAVHYLMKSAKVYEKKNEWEKALEQYETIKSKYPEEESYTTDLGKYIERAKAKLDKY